MITANNTHIQKQHVVDGHLVNLYAPSNLGRIYSKLIGTGDIFKLPDPMIVCRFMRIDKDSKDEAFLEAKTFTASQLIMEYANTNRMPNDVVKLIIDLYRKLFSRSDLVLERLKIESNAEKSMHENFTNTYFDRLNKENLPLLPEANRPNFTMPDNHHRSIKSKIAHLFR